MLRRFLTLNKTEENVHKVASAAVFVKLPPGNPNDKSRLRSTNAGFVFLFVEIIITVVDVSSFQIFFTRFEEEKTESVWVFG